MRTSVLLAMCMVLCGCSDRQAREQVSHQQVRMDQLEQAVTDLRNAQQRTEQDLAILREAQQRTRDDARKAGEQGAAGNAHAIEQLGQVVQESGARITSLEADARQLRVQIEDLRQQRAAPAPSSPAPVGSDFLEAPAGPEADLFPVRVTEVAGGKVVTGTHVSTQYVPDRKPVRDEFGSADYKMAETNVEESAYQVTCTLQNLTRTPKQVSLSAGETTEKLTLGPGETMIGVKVSAAMGAELSVMVGGYTRRYPVSY
ncbi:MAG: hypothetical protein V1873_06105 [Verrucomicrobiota bacterium]